MTTGILWIALGLSVALRQTPAPPPALTNYGTIAEGWTAPNKSSTIGLAKAVKCR